MKISVELTDEQRARLEEAARRLNLRPEQVAQAALDDFLLQEDQELESVADRLLEKNAELYRRLS